MAGEQDARARAIATQAKTLWLAIARAEQEVFEDELTYASVAPLIISALTLTADTARAQGEEAAYRAGYEFGKEQGLDVARIGCCYGWEYGWSRRARATSGDTP